MMIDLATRLASLTPEQRQLAERLLRERGRDPDTLPIPPRADRQRAPLSRTQRRLWESGRLAAESPYGNVPMAFRIRGPLDIDGFGRALAMIIERHEILRTTFPLEEGGPVQRIGRAVSDGGPAPPPIAVEDLRRCSSFEIETRFRERVHAEARRPFDPARETLLRARAFRLDEAEWGLLLVSHHLAMDGWGARLLVEELSAAYAACAADASGGPEEGGPPPIHYGDYAAWEAAGRPESGSGEDAGVGAEPGEAVNGAEPGGSTGGAKPAGATGGAEPGGSAGGAADAGVRYWLEHLEGAPLRVRLPRNPGRRPLGPVPSEAHHFALSDELRDQVRAFSRREGVTTYVTLLAAFQCLLSRHGPQPDVVTGSIVSRRTRAETESMIGNFANNLLFRSRFRAGTTFLDTVRSAEKAVRQGFVHGDTTLEELVEAAQKIGRPAPPAFHVAYIQRDGSLTERLELRGATVTGVPVSPGATALDLILDITDGPTGIHGYWDFATPTFDRLGVATMADRFLDLLGRVMADPHLPVEAALPAIPVEESKPARSPRRDASEESDTERFLVELCRDLLGIDRVGVHDNFYDLGGHSLAAMAVISRLETRTGCRVHPLDLATQSLGQIATQCSGKGADVGPRDVERDAEACLPLYFGPSSARIFGVHHPPVANPARTTAVVLCAPAWEEYVSAHRAFRVLARRLAERGFHVLRFDWRGVGDSGGSNASVSLAGWREDLGLAVEEIRRLSGCADTILVGLRIGASVALGTAPELSGVRALALWDPVLQGKSLLQSFRSRSKEWLAAEADERPRAVAAASRGPEFLPYRIGEPLESELAALDLRDARLPDIPILLLSDPTGDDALEPFAGRLLEGPERAVERVAAGPRVWESASGFRQVLVPTGELDTVVRWCLEVSP